MGEAEHTRAIDGMKPISTIVFWHMLGLCICSSVDSINITIWVKASVLTHPDLFPKTSKIYSLKKVSLDTLQQMKSIKQFLQHLRTIFFVGCYLKTLVSKCNRVTESWLRAERSLCTWVECVSVCGWHWQSIAFLKWFLWYICHVGMYMVLSIGSSV